MFRVESEVGQLRQVIVHRPGLELARLTPDNVHDLLFDDVLWAERAIEEHDQFVDVLQNRGVQVHYFNSLLGEALQQSEAREFLLERVVHEETVGPTLVSPLRKLIDNTEPQELADFMIGGILKKDLPAPEWPSLLWRLLDDEDFVLSPLPNHLFQRDNSAWVYSGVSVNPMAKAARKREAIHSRLIYRYHPMFAEQREKFAVYYGDDDDVHDPATCEGGDILVIGNGTVMIGLSERTTPQGA
ncbi:MAG TPA: arginine deiminase family protein, partial [Actinomycetes bacterium]|nr:arginine deiminase family protein [Actinomycetes bacterium]